MTHHLSSFIVTGTKHPSFELQTISWFMDSLVTMNEAIDTI
jgi:hypothetical protein